MRHVDTPEMIASRSALQRRLLDAFAKEFQLRTDAAIARAMGTQPPVISKWGSGKLAMGSCAIIRMHELTGWSTTQIKQRLNLPIVPSRKLPVA